MNAQDLSLKYFYLSFRAAEIVSTTANMNLTSGSVFGNPIPNEFEGNGSLYEGMIEQAVKESEEKRISGSQSTPFILSRLAELSKGETVKTNIALVVMLQSGFDTFDMSLLSASCLILSLILLPFCGTLRIDFCRSN